MLSQRTTMLASLRSSGEQDALTTSSTDVRHQYTGPPDPANPAANIPITVTLLDDNNGSSSGMISVRNPGIQTQTPFIDTTPDVPILELLPQPVTAVFIDQQTSSTQTLQSTESRIVSSDRSLISELYLELEVIRPDGTVSETHRIEEEALNDLRAFFRTLPDNHYRIYLVRTDNNSRRLIMDVYVRRGRIIDPADDSEGTRDRPPTGEQAPAAVVPLDENPLLERVPNKSPEHAPVPDESPSQPQAEPIESGRAHLLPPVPSAERSPSPRQNSESAVPIVPLTRSLRWTVPLVGLGLAAAGDWPRQVQSALERSQESDWQRLRRAGRLCKPARKLDANGDGMPIRST
jgi:hypothetical protein